MDSAIGRRIIIVGQTCAGKSTLGERLAVVLDAPFVELDALHWKPNWVGSSDEGLGPLIAAATAGDTWITSGDYHRVTRTITWQSFDCRRGL